MPHQVGSLSPATLQSVFYPTKWKGT